MAHPTMCTLAHPKPRNERIRLKRLLTNCCHWSASAAAVGRTQNRRRMHAFVYVWASASRCRCRSCKVPLTRCSQRRRRQTLPRARCRWTGRVVRACYWSHVCAPNALRACARVRWVCVNMYLQFARQRAGTQHRFLTWFPNERLIRIQMHIRIEIRARMRTKRMFNWLMRCDAMHYTASMICVRSQNTPTLFTPEICMRSVRI